MAIISRHSWPVVAIRTPFCIVVFIVGVLCIRFTQLVGYVLFKSLPTLYHLTINLTKVHFVTLLTFLTSIINPSKIVITYKSDEVPDYNSFKVDDSGNLSSILTPNSVWIGNHQIYTDWLFLWFVQYTGRFADSTYIVLKENLAKIPVLGPGMRVYKFLFLSRKWEADKVRLTNQLLELDADARGVGPSSGVKCVSSTNPSLPGVTQWPKGSRGGKLIWTYQLVIYPEGTVKSPHTRERSDKFITNAGRPLLKHVLLPRVRGLFLVLRLLRNTVEVVYDVACGYGGLTAADYGEDVFTLKAFYLLGYGPPSVNYHIRAWKLKDIPLGDDDSLDIDSVDPAVLKKFEDWLYDSWYAKDELLERFYQTGSFIDPKDENTNKVVADVKLRRSVEALRPFLVLVTCLILLRLAVKGLWALWSN